jgi:hypothetical protein
VPIQGEYEPSPWKFAADQVALYEATGGAEGGTLQDKPVVILTTPGRYSGKVRKTPLMRCSEASGLVPKPDCLTGGNAAGRTKRL